MEQWMEALVQSNQSGNLQVYGSSSFAIRSSK